MILAAGLLVLAGLGLFVGGILTGMTALYWGCVAACVVAAVLLFLARRTLGPAPAESPARTTDDPAAAPPARGSAAPPGPAETAVPGAAGATAAAGTGPVAQPVPTRELEDPPIEEVEVTDLLIVVDLKDEVLVIDERPRYHLAGCVHLVGRTGIPLPLDEARADGFTPCAVCSPDRNIAQRARDRRAAGSS